MLVVAECTEDFGQFQLTEELTWLGRPDSALIPRALWFSLSICLLLRFFLLTQTLRGCSASVHSYLAGAEPDKHRLGDARHPDLLLNRGSANGTAPVCALNSTVRAPVGNPGDVLLLRALRPLAWSPRTLVIGQKRPTFPPAETLESSSCSSRHARDRKTHQQVTWWIHQWARR